MNVRAPWLIALLAGCPVEPLEPLEPPEPTVAPTPTPESPPTSPEALPELEPIAGRGVVRVSAPSASAGQVMAWSDPLRIEVEIPDGVVVQPRGLRPEGDWLPPGADGLAVLQLSVPVHHDAQPDEERRAGTIGTFEGPRICPPTGDCRWGSEDRGVWRAWRVRDVGGQEETTPLHLGVARLDRADWHSDEARLEELPSVLSVWLDTRDLPLDGADRIVFSYVGALPRRSDAWLPPPMDALRVRVRYRTAERNCPTELARCWVPVDPAEVQPLQLQPRAPTHVRVLAPLDVTVGETFAARVVVLDRHGNPTPVTEDVHLVDRWGVSVGVVRLQDAWSGEALVAIGEAGPLSLEPDTDQDWVALRQWLMVHEADEQAPRRRVGDLHAHSGGEADRHFVPTWIGGDHRGDFTHARAALSYMREVVGYDFGAISEHAVSHEGWMLPPGVDPATFGPGGPCELDPDASGDQPDWWASSRASAEDFDGSHAEFSAFAAYEWHGRWQTDTQDARLHRVVVARDHQPAMPLLPGRTLNRPPQCLFAFLEGAGRTPADTLVLSHLMRHETVNRDWDITYDPPAPYDRLVAPGSAERWTRGVEIYSARNGQIHGSVDGSEVLHAFEGQADPAREPWSLRYGWRDRFAVIGVVGGSDAHSQTPGADELPPPAGLSREHRHDPGGLTVVLADPDAPQREGIFEGLSRRSTYATSGPRAWLDLHLDVPGVGPVGMGQEITTDAASIEADVRLMVGRSIRELQLWSAEVGQDAPYRLLTDGQLYASEDVRLTHRIPNPASGEPETWLYYVRAHLGQNLDGTADAADHQDGVWSSPIWVTWNPTP